MSRPSIFGIPHFWYFVQFRYILPRNCPYPWGFDGFVCYWLFRWYRLFRSHRSGIALGRGDLPAPLFGCRPPTLLTITIKVWSYFRQGLLTITIKVWSIRTICVRFWWGWGDIGQLSVGKGDNYCGGRHASLARWSLARSNLAMRQCCQKAGSFTSRAASLICVSNSSILLKSIIVSPICYRPGPQRAASISGTPPRSDDSSPLLPGAGGIFSSLQVLCLGASLAFYGNGRSVRRRFF